MQNLKVGLTLSVALLFGVGNVMAQAPTTSDPSNRLIPGYDAPGMYPTTVTAANIDMAPQPGVELDGAGEDFLSFSVPAAGPISWTSSRYNGGDIALSIGVAEPNNPLSYPPAGFNNNYQAMNANSNPIDPNSSDLSTLAWRVSNQTGGLLATTRHNGVDNGYTIAGSGGTSTGTYHGVSYFGDVFGQGWGFQMEDGVFDNGGGNSADLITGHAGDAGGRSEACFNTSVAYFPYEQGWLGAWVDENSTGAATFDGNAPSVDTSAVNWTNGLADVQLPGVDSATDGMLFVAPSDDSSTTRIASAFPNSSGGWTTTVRLDDDADTTGQTYLDASGNGFQFLYMPYNTENLIGGHVEGADGTMINSAGDTSFSLTRNSSGNYSLSVFEADGVTKKTEDSGMLVLSVADTMVNDTTLGSRSFMSYEYDGLSGDFIIESRELIDISSTSAFDNFGNEFAGSDSDFYFAWVDFANPLSVAAAMEGDYDGDGSVGQGDLDIVLLNWGGTNFSGDENAIPGGGPFDGDMSQNELDGVLLNWGNTSLVATAAAVPEPATLAMLGIGLGSVLVTRKRRAA